NRYYRRSVPRCRSGWNRRHRPRSLSPIPPKAGLPAGIYRLTIASYAVSISEERPASHCPPLIGVALAIPEYSTNHEEQAAGAKEDSDHPQADMRLADAISRVGLQAVYFAQDFGFHFGLCGFHIRQLSAELVVLGLKRFAGFDQRRDKTDIVHG